jgi:CRP-like cAMP-binding protein
MDLLEVFENSDDHVNFPEGAVVFEEGSEGDYMYVLIEGKIRISLHNEAIAMVVPGEIVGEMALLNSDARSATATAITDCRLAPIDLHSFKLLIQHTPDFALHVMNVLADRLRLANETLAS